MTGIETRACWLLVGALLCLLLLSRQYRGVVRKDVPKQATNIAAWDRPA